jgi:hypothetical protein
MQQSLREVINTVTEKERKFQQQQQQQQKLEKEIKIILKFNNPLFL